MFILSSHEHAAPAVDQYPLSPFQEGLLYQTLHSSGQNLYTEQMVLALAGKIDFNSFVAAWQQVMARHDVLRSAVVWGDKGEPLQAVFENVELPVIRLDWTAIEGPALAARLHEFLDCDRRRGIDVSRAPLMRLAIVEAQGENSRVILTFHHMLMDGWSLALLLQEVFAAYARRRQGSCELLPPGPSFREYINWIHNQDSTAARRFWEKDLAGFAPQSHGSNRASEGGEANRAPLVKQREVLSTEHLEQVARELRITLNTLVNGAFALLLGYCTGREDVIFGQVVSGRSAAIEGIESMVGLCINTLPFRVKPDKNCRAIEWLRRLQRHHAELREYFYTPLAQIANWHGLPPRETLIDCLLDCQEQFSLEEWNDLADGCGFRVAALQYLHQNEYPFRALVEHHGGKHPELIITLECEQNRFTALSADRIGKAFISLIELLARHPHRRLLEILAMLQDLSPDFAGAHAPAKSH
jgi:hypothetical protein